MTKIPPYKSKLLLGQILINKGVVTVSQLDQALAEQRKTGQMLGTVLIRLGFISDEQELLPIVAEQLNVDCVYPRSLSINPEILSRLPVKAAKYYKVLPIRFEQDGLVVAMCNPGDVRVIDELATIAKSKIIPALASEREILESIQEYYGVGAETIEKMMTGMQRVQEDSAVESIDEGSSEASISHFLNQILFQAYKDKATDIHIEPFEDQLRIRTRIDGVLYDVKSPDNIRYFQDTLLSRIKIMSNLNIAEKRLPQDGRFKVKAQEQDLDLRVSFLPTPYGESCVLRILNSVNLYSFPELGIVGSEKKQLDQLLNKSHGIIFLTGPTGSGKTTTLYSCLAQLNNEDSKIITIEDPIEYQMRGVIQIQVHPQIGLTFAAGLRSILRSDPDVIMIGEVRDSETAQISIQMSLTGHLVFSTLHTNDAVSGITRLMDMGIEPYLIASSIEGFIAQRLVRLLCPSCKRPAQITSDIIRDFNLNEQEQHATVYEAGGCKNCRMTGYWGRQAICEILILSDEIRSMVMRRVSGADIKQKAILEGMKTLRRHGWEKVASGVTSPSEILRSTQENTL
ncbi:MAG: Flp pilus assembly complex ATPase component TadA [Candidatus Omnitrophica bacterium]|nr:Flp pilus assembly complex ATPase component TadA [Candidatus Omnitrophota bacterium]